MVDLLGFGRGRGQPFVLGEASGVLANWMDLLGLRRANLVGHSVGGYISLDLATHHPEQVERLVLVDALALAMGRTYLRHALNLLRALRYMPFNFLPVLAQDTWRAGPATMLRAIRAVLNADNRADLTRLHPDARRMGRTRYRAAI